LDHSGYPAPCQEDEGFFDMPKGRALVVGVISVALMLVIAACGVAHANQVSPASPQTRETVWGKVPYCNCFGDAMTAHVARELAEADLTVDLQEQSPREGWLYFAVTYEPAAATRAQIAEAIAAGGGEMLAGPP
jgi:hypothetical protein